jgi:hypothetical protein
MFQPVYFPWRSYYGPLTALTLEVRSSQITIFSLRQQMWCTRRIGPEIRAALRAASSQGANVASKWLPSRPVRRIG